MKTYEGVHMNYTPTDPVFADLASNKAGCVVEETSREAAGLGMEPSGHWFMNYRDVTTYTFHPYDGSAPVPCCRPSGGVTRQRGL